MAEIDEALEWLDVEDDDEAVLSAICEVDDAGVARLFWATIVLATPDVTSTGWPGRGLRGTELRPALESIGAGRWLGTRTPLSKKQAWDWVVSALNGGSPAVGNVELHHPDYTPANAPLLLTPLSDTHLSSLVSGLGRPLDCFWFPSGGEPVVLPDGEAWDLSHTTGMYMSGGVEGARKYVPGLLIGKLRRRGWLKGVRGGPELSTFTVTVKCEPGRLAYSELEIELEEQVDDEVADVRRLALGDLRLPNVPRDAALVVEMPTLGPRVKRRVRLWDNEGQLLDQTGIFNLVEQINLQIGLIDGGEVRTSSIGGALNPSLVERLDRARLVRSQYEDLLRDGMDGRVVTTRADAHRILTSSLTDARSEVLVLDPYFGNDVADWSMLNAASVPVRVLTWQADTAGVPPSRVTVKRWHGKAPFHDRLYLWKGGGLSVGTSPNGFGNRAFRIDRLDRPEAEAWRVHFEAWWSDPHTRPL